MEFWLFQHLRKTLTFTFTKRNTVIKMGSMLSKLKLDDLSIHHGQLTFKYLYYVFENKNERCFWSAMFVLFPRRLVCPTLQHVQGIIHHLPPPTPVSSSLSTPTNITQLQSNCVKKVHKDSLNFRGIKICFVKIRLKANKSVKSNSWSKKFTFRLYSWCVCYYRRGYTNQWLW